MMGENDNCIRRSWKVNMAAGMIKIFLVFIGIFILSTLTMICFYFYNKSKEKKQIT